MTPNPLYKSPCHPKLFTQDRAVNPLDPESFEPSLDEIVHALPNINRYNGHTIRPYSVAEHSMNCAIIAYCKYDLTETHHRLYFLLHDAAETYLQDIVRPLKRFVSDEVLKAEYAITDKLLQLIPFTDKHHWEFNSARFQAIADEIDTRMAVTEVEQLIPHHKDPIKGFKPYNLEIKDEHGARIHESYALHVNHLMEKLNEER